MLRERLLLELHEDLVPALEDREAARVAAVADDAVGLADDVHHDQLVVDVRVLELLLAVLLGQLEI